jgi:diguanylate cyclase (GGDEF)-like protein
MSKESPILFCDHRGEGSEDIRSLLEALGQRVITSSYLRHSIETLTDVSPRLVVVHALARHGQVEIRALDAARDRSAQNGRLVEAVALLIVGTDELAPLAAAGLTGGPWDVIRRGASPEEWRLRIERLEAERIEAGRVYDLAHRASHDDLTGLLRKNAFQDRLQEHFSAAQRHRFDLALVLLDLDDFGLVNKRHDHLVGDHVIRRVGEVIHHALRTEDIAGRLGGDEFAVLLPYTRKMDAAAVVKRLRDEIHRLSGHMEGAKSEIQVGSSIGFETFDGADLASLEELRKNAERALRVAKERGGNQGVYFRTLEELAP